MSKDSKLLDEVIESGNHILLEQLKSSGEFSEADIRAAVSRHNLKMCLMLKERGYVMDIDDLEEYVSAREAVPYDDK